MVWNSQGGVPRGTQLNGIYEIESLIAQGGMGEVYSGRAIQTGDRVAIKMILPEHANNPTIVDLFRREASTLHNLYNEAIVRYYVFSVDPGLGRPYLAMEFVDGPSLKDLMRKGPVSVGDIDILRRRLSLGLHAAHELGVIHRDISPDNVILPGGSVHKAKIIDFGIAKSGAAEGTLIGSGMAGKLNYVSPEQLGLYGGDVTGKSDMYSLGLVLAAAAIGEPINMGGSQVEVVEKRRALPDLSRVPAEIRPLIAAMVQPDPAKRPATLAEVATFDLSKLPKSRGGQGGGGGRKGGGGGLIAAFAVLAVLGSVGGGLYYVGALDKIIGGDATPTPTPPLDPIPTPDPNAPTPTPEPTRAPTATPVPAGAGAPEAVPGAVTAGNAQVARSYRWISDPFRHERPDLLVLDIVGDLPPGLRFEDTGTGQAVLYGVPTVPGSFALTVVASDPDGREGRLSVTIEVAPAEAPPATLAPPTPTAEAIPTPVPAIPTPIPAAPTPAQPEPTSIFVRPPTPVPTAEPTPVPTAEPTAVPTPLPTEVPTPVPTAIPTPIPPTPIPPTPVPPTPVPPTPAPPTPAPNANNLAPQVVDQVRAAIPLDVGRDTNIRIGSFADPEDGTTLDIQLEGALPPGLFLNRAAGAVVAVYGTPSAPGTFSFQVTAVDSGGARVSIPVTIVVIGAGPTAAAPEPTPVPAGPTPAPLEPTPVPVQPTPAVPQGPSAQSLAYIAAYDGGPCFLAQPLEMGDRAASIAVYAGAPEPIFAFNEHYIRDRGYEAQIVAALLSPPQCALAQALTPAGRVGLASDLRIVLLKEELASGEVVSGRMENSNASVRLFIFESTGAVTELTQLLQGGTLFSFQFAGSGYQVIAAVRPKPGLSLPPGGSLLDLVPEVNAGRADISLTYFNVR